MTRSALPLPSRYSFRMRGSVAHHGVAGHEVNDVYVDLLKRLHKGVLQHTQRQDADGGLSHEVGALQVKEWQHLSLGLFL